MPLVERPLAAVLAEPSIRRPRDLEGHSAGVTGLPSDDAVLSSIVSGDGGDPKRVKHVTIGFEAVSALLAHRVAAATGFWNVEGVALHDKRPATHQFLVDEFGAPPYPELVLCVSRRTLDDDPTLVRATTDGGTSGNPTTPPTDTSTPSNDTSTPPSDTSTPTNNPATPTNNNGNDNTTTPSTPTTNPRCIVPKLQGKKLAAARTALTHAHCKLGKVTKRHASRKMRGRVIAQSPKPRSNRPPGSKVGVVVGK